MLENTALLSFIRNTIELVGFSALFLLLDNPKYSWKKTIAGYGIYTVVYIVLGTAWIVIDMISFGKFITLSIFVGALLFFPLMSADNPFQVFYNLSLQIFILIMQIVVSIWAATTFFGGNPWADVVFRLLYLVVVVWCYLRFLRKPFREISDIRPKGWLLMSVVSVGGNLFVIYYWTRPEFLMLRSKADQWVFICIWGLLFTTHLIMIQALTFMKREMTAKNEGEMAAVTSRMLTLQLELLEESVQDAKRIRHDARHHNMQIAEYVKKGELDELLQYLGRCEKDAQNHVVMAICENPAANNILGAYTRKARQHGIEVRLSVELERDIIISDIDMVAMLANLMENAIHGCIHSGVPDPFIELYVRRKGAKLVICIRNTSGNDVVLENGLPKSKDGGGIGVSSILYSAAKYGGEHDFKAADGVFSCQLLLKVPQVGKSGMSTVFLKE